MATATSMRMQSTASQEPAYIQNSPCNSVQQKAAAMVKELHDRIEIVAYRAFGEILQKLGITGNAITIEQSGQILEYVKRQAHVELYRKDGYWQSRLKILDEDRSQLSILIKEQFEQQVNGLARLVHDRDVKLTDARYHSLTDVLMALDDHGYMVKENLLRSWYKCPNKAHGPGREILEEAKLKAGFYKLVNAQLNFDLKTSLAARQAFFDRYFPGIREPEKGREFVHVIEVRDFLSRNIAHIDVTHPGERLVDFLQADAKDLFEARTFTNLVRSNQVQTLPPLLHNRSISVGEFMKTYFPEMVGETKGSKKLMPPKIQEKEFAKSKISCPSAPFLIVTIAILSLVVGGVLTMANALKAGLKG